MRMAREIDEASASGEVAVIYDEVRRLWGVGYVSSIHRYLAGMPGFLEWAWAAVAPVFRNRVAQEKAWACSAALSVPELEPIPLQVQRVWGLRDDGHRRAIAAGLSFERVAPVNMIFAALIKRLLVQRRTATATPVADRAWMPLDDVGELPDMIDLQALDEMQRDVVNIFADQIDGRPFVPGLYRMIAQWPGLIAHLAVVLPPVLNGAQARAAYDQLRRDIDTAADEVVGQLSSEVAGFAMPDPTARALFRAAGETYRRTSPEMVVAGRLVAGALERNTSA